jgi:hypothetical protein
MPPSFDGKQMLIFLSSNNWPPPAAMLSSYRIESMHASRVLPITITQCWQMTSAQILECRGKEKWKENGVLPHWTYWYPFDHRSQAALGPVSS